MKKNGLIYSNMFFLLHPNCHCWAHSWPGSQSEELLYLLSLPPAPVAAVLGRIICPSQPGHSKGTFRLNDEKKTLWWFKIYLWKNYTQWLHLPGTIKLWTVLYVKLANICPAFQGKIFDFHLYILTKIYIYKNII